MKDLSILAEIIRDARVSLPLSQSALAVKCDLDPSYISKIERNQLGYPPSKDAISSLAHELNLDAYHLQLVAGHIPEDILSLIINFLLAYPKERAKEILEKLHYQAFL